MIILFKIIRFYLKKISETNTSQTQNRGYSSGDFWCFCLKFASGRSLKMTAKLCRRVPAASAVQERFWEVTLSKNYGNGNTAEKFVSPHTVDFKMQTSYTVRLEITASWGFFSPQQCIKNAQHRNTANP